MDTAAVVFALIAAICICVSYVSLLLEVWKATDRWLPLLALLLALPFAVATVAIKKFSEGG